MNKALSVAGVVASFFLTTGVVTAQQPDTHKRTILTFNTPVRLPGITLPAGTYDFEHLTSATGHVVEVRSEDGKKAYGTFVTMPSELPVVADKPFAAFKEGPSTEAVPLRAWFFPGEKTGDEFVYSDAEASDIYNATQVPVLTKGGGHFHGKDAKDKDKDKDKK